MNTTDWEQQIKSLRRLNGWTETDIPAMSAKFAEEAREFGRATYIAWWQKAPKGPIVETQTCTDAQRQARDNLREEAGDVLVMLMANLAPHGITLADAMQEALGKLTRRAEERGGQGR